MHTQSCIEATVRIEITRSPKVLSVSDGIEPLLGVSASQLLTNGVTFTDLIHPDDKDIQDLLFNEDVSESEDSVDLRMRQTNGRIRCIYALYKREINTEGQLILELRLIDAKSIWLDIDIASLNCNFTAMMDNTDDFIYFKDRHHVFTGASQTLVDVTNPSNHWTDLLGKTDYDVFPEDYADAYYQLEKQVFAGIPIAHEIQQTINNDGRKGWVDNRKYPITDESGNIVGLFGIARDITDQKRAEQLLSENEKRFRAIFEQVPSISVQGYNKDRKVIFWNKASEVLYGYSREQAIGKRLEDLIIPQPMREEVVRLVSAWAEGGPAIPAAELELIDANGCKVDVFSSHVMLTDSNGESEMYCIDVSLADRKSAEAALRESEEFMRTVIDEIPDPIIIKDHNANFLLTNKAVAQLYNTEPDAMVGKDDADFGVPREMADFFRENVLAIMRKGEPEIVLEDSFDSVTGKIRHYKSIKRPFKNKQGKDQILVVAQEITDILEAQKKVAESEQRLQQVMEITNEGIWDWHIPTGLVIHNSQWYETLLRKPGDVPDTFDDFAKLIHPEERKVVSERLQKLIKGISDNYYSEHRLRRNDGCYIWVQDRGTVVERDAGGEPQRVIGSFRDISFERSHQQYLEKLAHYDVLTNLPNRSLLADRLQQAMAAALRRSSKLAIAYLDLDGFKSINDTHGHDTGDQMLVALADRMKHVLRDGDTLARIGGDEFVAVLIDLPDIEACVPMVSRLLDAAADTIVHDGLSLKVTASLGITFFPQALEINADQLLRQADHAMYQAKLTGKNRFHIFDMDQDLAVRGHHESLGRVTQGLENREFILYFQPKVNMHQGIVTGVEALIRWQHPDKGLLPPADFLPVIEDHQLAVDIGEWVMEATMVQIEQWLDLNLDISVSVNISARQLQQKDFSRRLQNVLLKHPRVKPEYLILEVLETSAFEDIALVSQIIEDCADLGVAFALDDFGTGYSSLTYLKRLSVAELKIDQTFVRDMLDDPEDLAILEGVIGLANAFRNEAIAEGVETIEHGELLLQLGCELAQGYAIARPMPAEQIPGWIKSWKAPPRWLNATKTKPEDLPVLYAIVEHRAWITVLKNYLQGKCESPPQLDHHQCRFGVLMNRNYRNGIDLEPRFKEIYPMHLKIHSLASKLCDVRLSGSEVTQSQIRELFSLRDQLVDQLQQILVNQ